MARADFSLYDSLPPAGKKLARVPRIGRLIGKMASDRHERLESNAAVYWEVLHYIANNEVDATGLIDAGLRTAGAGKLGWRRPGIADREISKIRRWQSKLASDMLSAVAFEMFLGENGDGKDLPIFVVEGDVDSFLNDRVYHRIRESGCYVSSIGDPLDPNYLDDDWEFLCQMNAKGLEYLILGDSSNARIFFTDRSMQTFFAARWASNHILPNDLEKIKNWYPVDDDHKESYDEFWSYVIDLERFHRKHFRDEKNRKSQLISLGGKHCLHRFTMGAFVTRGGE